jgi:hypothetical protein
MIRTARSQSARGGHFRHSARNRDRGLVVGLPPETASGKKVAEAYRQICYPVSRYMNQRQEVLLPDDPLVRVQESRRHPR